MGCMMKLNKRDSEVREAQSDEIIPKGAAFHFLREQARSVRLGVTAIPIVLFCIALVLLAPEASRRHKAPAPGLVKCFAFRQAQQPSAENQQPLCDESVEIRNQTAPTLALTVPISDPTPAEALIFSADEESDRPSEYRNERNRHLVGPPDEPLWSSISGEVQKKDERSLRQDHGLRDRNLERLPPGALHDPAKEKNVDRPSASGREETESETIRHRRLNAENKRIDALQRQFDKLAAIGEAEEADSLRSTLPELMKRAAGKRALSAQPTGGLDDSAAPASDSAIRAFLEERSTVDGVAFVEARGYWANTYVPGDRVLRRLRVRLDANDRIPLQKLTGRQLRLHDVAALPTQPFDPPNDAAISVFLHTDRRAIDSRQRVLLEVGVKGTSRRRGARPVMNVGIVLDLRGPLSGEVKGQIRALVDAFAGACNLGDRFSITVAGRPGGLIVPAERFRHGPLLVAMNETLDADVGADAGLLLPDALEVAIRTVSNEDDPSSQLGSSTVLLVTTQPLGAPNRLARIAHTSAVAGIPISIVGVGPAVRLEELDAIALAGQGNRRLLNDETRSEAMVHAELEAVTKVVTRALRLRIRLAPGVQLVDVIGSSRLDVNHTQKVRDTENAIDRRLAHNLGITADRGLDDEGIQIVIPAFYAEDEHVILLDLVSPGPGPLADVTARFKDLVWMKNGVVSANLSLERGQAETGPLEHNVIKNFLVKKLGECLLRAASAFESGKCDAAIAILQGHRSLLRGLPRAVPALDGDPDLAIDAALVDEYLQLLGLEKELGADDRLHIVDSLIYSGRMQIVTSTDFVKTEHTLNDHQREAQR